MTAGAIIAVIILGVFLTSGVAWVVIGNRTGDDLVFGVGVAKLAVLAGVVLLWAVTR